MNFLLSTIIVLIVGYGQLVTSQSGEPDSIVSCVNGYGVDYSCPGKSCRDIYNYNMDSQDITGLRLRKSTRCIVTWS